MSVQDFDPRDHGISLAMPPGRPPEASPVYRLLKLVTVLLFTTSGALFVCGLVGV